MKAFLLIISAAGVLGLTGCTATLSPEKASTSEASQVAIDTNAKYEEQIVAVSKEMRGICASSAFQSYFKKTACFPPGITERQLRDRTRITKEQRRAAVRVFELQHELNTRTRDIMIKSGDKKMIELAKRSQTDVMPAVEALQKAFLSGSITWGEYNTTRLRLFEENRPKTTAD